MKTNITTFHEAPYFDDFNLPDKNQDNKNVFEKNYHRLLFQPSYAIQTRELNQLQSILQHQIGELASSLINAYHGGVIKEGETELINNVRFVDVEFDNPFTVDIKNKIDLITRLETRNESNESDLQLDILGIRYVDGETYRIWFKYRNTGAVPDLTENDVIFPFTEDEEYGPVIEEGQNVNDIITNSPYESEEIPDEYKEHIHTLIGFGRVISSVGWGFSINVNEGIFLVQGTAVHTFPQREFFIKEQQNDIIDGYISFLIKESIITPEEDATLRDNAAGTYNYAAPGADRYCIELELAFNTNNSFILNANALTSRVFNGEDEEFSAPFINVRTIRNNSVMNISAPLSLSESIEAGTAKRTYDESGNYTVRPFTISIKEALLENHNNGKHLIEDALRNTTLIALYHSKTGQHISEESSANDIDEYKSFLRDYVAIDIDPSTAYVKGHRIETGGTRTVYLKKARDLSDSRTVGLNLLRGNYIDVLYDPDETEPIDFNNILGEKIRGIKFIGTITQRDLEYNAPAEIGQEGYDTRAGWFIYRLYVYNNFVIEDIPAVFHLRYIPSSIDDTNNQPIEDKSIKNPRTSTSFFPIGYKGVKDVEKVQFGFLKRYNNQSQSGGVYTLTTSTANEVFNINSLNDIIVSIDDKLENAAEIFESYALNGNDLTLTLKSGPSTGDREFIVPMRVIGNHTFRRTKTVETHIETIDVNCETGIAVLSKQDVIISSIKCGVNDCILSHRVIDDGLGDNFYENPILKFNVIKLEEHSNGYGTTPVEVEYEYYEHSGGQDGAGYFTVNSYPIISDSNFDHIEFERIPKQGDSRLSDYIDFRVKRERTYNHETHQFTTEDATSPILYLQANIIGEVDFTHFLPRVDVLFLNAENELGERGLFEILEGTPSLDPVPKRINSTSMALYELNIPPYTYFPHNINKGYIDNNRYTMNDISRLEKRIENLEYYSSLSLLEKEAENRKILDLSEEGAGFERFKNGILVDSFLNQNVGDIANPDYSAAVNPSLKTMGPAFDTHIFRAQYTKRWKDGAEFNSNTGNNPGYTGDEQISLDTGEREVLFESLYASQSVSVQPYEVTTWTGRIKLSPSSDEWIDTERLPDFAVDFSAFNNFMNDVSDILIDLWGTNETLINTTLVGTRLSTSTNVQRQGHGTLTTTTNTTTNTFEREIERDWLESTINSVDIDFGDRVVDVSIIPWIRSRDIHFKGIGFKPNTPLYLFFDGVNVTEYAKEAAFELFANIDDIATYNNQSPVEWSEEAFGALHSNENGEIEGILRIPNNDDIRFRTGIRELKITSSPNNNDLEADTIATTTYSAMGLVQQKEFVGAAARVPQIELQTETVFNRFNRSSSASTSVYRDPIAQTFYIDSAEYGSGVFLTDVDLFFATIPDNVNSIITVYLVKCENGIPTKYIVPGSEKTLKAGDIINVSGREAESDEELNIEPTRFTFDFPVYLEGGEEYALIVFGDTPEYRIWTGVLGQQDLITNYPITKNPSFGVFLQSQNQRTWTPYQYRNMMIRLHKAVFDTNKTVTFEFSTDVGDQDLSDIYLTYVQPFFRTLELPQTRLDLNIILANSSGNILAGNLGAKYIASKLLSPGDEIPFTHHVVGAKKALINIRLTTFNRNVSPVVDCETGSLYFRSNRVNNLLEGEGAIYDHVDNTWSPSENVPSSGGEAQARYITKRVVLNNPSEDLRTILAIHRPTPNANIKVFAKRKVLSKFDKSIQNETGWYEMQLYSVNGDTSVNTIPINRIGANDFTDVEFILPFPDPNFEDAVEMQPDEETSIIEGFSEFMVKIVFLSEDKAQVCKIKNLMVIASL